MTHEALYLMAEFDQLWLIWQEGCHEAHACIHDTLNQLVVSCLSSGGSYILKLSRSQLVVRLAQNVYINSPVTKRVDVDVLS